MPRIELHTSPRGWAYVFHLDNGMSRSVPLRNLINAAAAMRAGIVGRLPAGGTQYEPELRALLTPPAGA